MNDKIVIYRTEDGQTAIDVKLEQDTVWLSANQMSTLFDRDEKTIRKHKIMCLRRMNWKEKTTRIFCVLME